MSDPAQPVSPFSQSYVDTYVPPAVHVTTPPTQVTSPYPGPTPTTTNNAAPVMPAVPALPTTGPVVQPPEVEAGPTEKLEDQNIFELLGVKDGTDEEKEAFLDELQHVIWEDFIENDVILLITQEEQAELKTIQSKPGVSEPELQEATLVFLEPLIPDLEQVLLEKALELKEDMVKERILGMKTYYAQQPAALQTLAQAEDLMRQDKWLSVAKQLNSIQN